MDDIEISSWSYKDDPTPIRHMGPTAQDFYAAFGLGRDERHIATLDVNGVSLAAIQELHRKAREEAAKSARLEKQNAKLEARLEALERLVRDLIGQSD
ncbi:MAG: hypothetical protein GY720_10445 [bacterium]|nr:hypothetical protein [bacterium]